MVFVCGLELDKKLAPPYGSNPWFNSLKIYLSLIIYILTFKFPVVLNKYYKSVKLGLISIPKVC